MGQALFHGRPGGVGVFVGPVPEGGPEPVAHGETTATRPSPGGSPPGGQKSPLPAGRQVKSGRGNQWKTGGLQAKTDQEAGRPGSTGSPVNGRIAATRTRGLLTVAAMDDGKGNVRKVAELLELTPPLILLRVGRYPEGQDPIAALLAAAHEPALDRQGPQAVGPRKKMPRAFHRRV